MNSSIPLINQASKLPGRRTAAAWAIASVLGLAVVSMTGCAGKYTGSGSIPSVAGDANKAIIAFNVQTDGDADGDGAAEVKGQIQFQDVAAGVMVHGEILDATLVPDGGYMDLVWFPEGSMIFTGTYTSQPPSSGKSQPPLGGNTGDFIIVVYSPQTPGSQGGVEQLYVLLWGGQEAYYNVGSVSGGNITYHKAK